MLLEDLLEAFLYSRKHALGNAKLPARSRTVQNYKEWLTYFNTFMRDERKRVHYEDITRNDIQAYVEHINTNPRWKSPASRWTYLRAIKTLFKFIEQDEECRASGMKSWAHLIGKIPANPRREFIPTKKDLKGLRADWDTDTVYGFRNFVIFTLILGTGMRVGEVCYLKLEHLQLDQSSLSVPREGKTGSRLVALEDQVVNLLRLWLRKRARICGVSKTEFVFIGRGGRQCNRNMIGKAFRIMQPESKSGYRITPHTLRHAFGTYYLRNGGTLERLRLILGHTDYKSTQVYLHLAEVGSKEAKDELEKASPLKMLAAHK